MWVTNQRSACTISTAIDCTNPCRRDDIDARIPIRSGSCTDFTSPIRDTLVKVCYVIPVCILGFLSLGLKTIDRVRSQVTTSIQLINHNRRTAVLLDRNSDLTINRAGTVVTTKDFRVMTVGDMDVHIAIDIRFVGAAIEFTAILNTVEDYDNRSVGISTLTATVCTISNDTTGSHLLNL